ncbi:MAG: hypothetical protein HY665_05450 [Chloroflexi bacterium]|nr:hypothetical protein [Chloroflexota bacterium]
MKSQALQQFVKKVFGDEKTRTRFLSDPDSVLSQFALSEQEKRAVRTTYAKLGYAAGSSQLALTMDGPWSAPMEATLEGPWSAPLEATLEGPWSAPEP